jgi:hypothetical protein
MNAIAKLVLPLAAVLMTGVSAPADASPAKGKPACARDQEKLALDTRVLQTELMIAALSCGQAEQYNQFVSSFQPQLQQQGDRLVKFFDRVHGKDAPDRLNAFVTKLANDSSTRSQKVGYGYCLFTYDLFNEALATPPQDFGKLTEKPWIPVRHGYATCKSS